MKKPYLFDEFFASGFEDTVSPFLTPNSRAWGKNLLLKSTLGSAFLLSVAFGLSFLQQDASYLVLSFVYFLVGSPAIIATINDIKSLEINIDVLMTLAAFIAILMGSPVEGALLLVLFSLSHALEDLVSAKTRGALHNLNNIAPKFALLIDDKGRFFEKSVREIAVGDVIQVKNEEIIPLDGTIVEGTSSLNLVHLTGESLPVKKTVGDLVPAGAKNVEGALLVKVTRTAQDSTLTKIVQLITQASEAKPKVQRFLDRFSSRYATSVILLTCFFALLMPFVLSVSYLGIEGSIYRSLAFLIAASPCALIIATPTAYLSTISACAKKGILLKGGVTLDALSGCSTVAFDKTGTLTTGELTCQEILPFEGSQMPEEKVLSIAYGLEKHVVHPVSKAICTLAQKKEISPLDVSDFKAIPGSGLTGTLNNSPVAIGHPDFIATKMENPTPFLSWVASIKEKNQIVAALLVTRQVFLFVFSDQIREDVPSLIQTMKKTNALDSVMLTGDHKTSALSVAKEVGIETVYAALTPESKLEKVSNLSEKGGLAMVGDGVNDAPSLARASVGISMGKVGSATAVDASDVVLLNDDIHLLSWLFSKAHKTKKIVKQNLSVALCVICVATIPALLGLVPLWAAVILHEGGTVLVGLNSLRLLRS